MRVPKIDGREIPWKSGGGWGGGSVIEISATERIVQRPGVIYNDDYRAEVGFEQGPWRRTYSEAKRDLMRMRKRTGASARTPSGRRFGPQPPEPRRPTTKSGHEAAAGFAIAVYDEDLVQENARDRYGPQGSDLHTVLSRWEAIESGLVDRQGTITPKGWDLLNRDVGKIERNSLSWLSRKFKGVRDEGHGSFDELIGTVWFNPQNPEQAYLIDLAAEAGQGERIDMSDASYGDLADSVFDGVSDFGGSVLGGAITFFNVEPESWAEIEATLERQERR